MFRYIIITIVVVGIALALLEFPALNEIGGGITILLLSIINLEAGFKIFTEGPLRKYIHYSTNNYFKSLSLGIVSTAVLNSSSLISVLVISFISAGMITLKAGIWIIFGSNLGTTFTAWLIALFGLNFKISVLAMPMIIFGVIFILQKIKKINGFGYILLGLGFLFLGIHFLKSGFDSLNYNFEFLGIKDPDIISLLLMLGLGILVTIILQSSAASLAIILTALSSGQISYIESLALAIGTNIGTTFTALIGSIASGAEGKKLALAHLIFNLITGLIAVVFLRPFMTLVDVTANIFGIGSTEFTIKMALFHSYFNVFGILLMSPFSNQLVRLLDLLIKVKDEDVVRTKYLNKSILDHPESTITALLMETEHLLDHTFEIMAHSLNTHRKDIIEVDNISQLLERSGDSIPIDIDEEYFKKVKFIYSKILKYSSLTQKQNLTDEEQKTISNIIRANRLIVSVIKDLQELRKNLNEYLYSNDEHVREVYQEFRKRILKIIKELFLNIIHYPYQVESRHATTGAFGNKQLEKMNKNIEHQRSRIDQLESEVSKIISNLISERQIRSKIASSVINDSTIVTRIGTNLLAIMELLYTEISELEVENDVFTGKV